MVGDVVADVVNVGDRIFIRRGHRFSKPFILKKRDRYSDVIVVPMRSVIPTFQQVQVREEDLAGRAVGSSVELQLWNDQPDRYDLGSATFVVHRADRSARIFLGVLAAFKAAWLVVSFPLYIAVLMGIVGLVTNLVPESVWSQGLDVLRWVSIVGVGLLTVVIVIIIWGFLLGLGWRAAQRTKMPRRRRQTDGPEVK